MQTIKRNLGGKKMEMFFIILLFLMNIMLFLMYKDLQKDIEDLYDFILSDDEEGEQNDSNKQAIFTFIQEDTK